MMELICLPTFTFCGHVCILSPVSYLFLTPAFSEAEQVAELMGEVMWKKGSWRKLSRI